MDIGGWACSLTEISFSRVTVFVFSCQTAEEIEQLTVDEDLNDIERAVYLLRWVPKVRSNHGAVVGFCVLNLLGED